MRSLIVGPHARLTGYAEPLFRILILELPPGTRVADLSALGFHGKVRSLRMECDAGSGPVGQSAG
jgi:hypothetical protein